MTGSRTLSDRLGLRMRFKLELFQKTGSFKVRGVLNKLHHLSAEEKKRGVISMSSGNHAQALSFAASSSEIPATIVMPSWSRDFKVEATRSYGGKVVLTDDDLMETVAAIQQQGGQTFVHPFDDPLIIAGHGTVGLEILEDVPSPDYVLVTIGGGGLISGIAAAVKGLSPSTRVIGVEPRGAAAMTASLQRGKPVKLEKVDTIADGLAAPFAGRENLAMVQQYVDEVLLVSDDEIVEAMALILERLKVVVEPSAAAALAPLLSGALKLPEGSQVVCVLCGGNVDRATLAKLLTEDFAP